jgi:hypothetical protein|nr:MAG TPA: Protein of unknown function (DUF1642) [Caudoviricetes sp.]
MNKQELIKKYENEWKEHSPFNETASYALIVKSFLDQLKKRDEPQKVTIPQFVADWIEYCKEHNFTLFGCLDPANGFESLAGETFEGDVRKCIRWCRKESNNFARAWLDGYTVEKEKRYLVKIKGIDSKSCYLKRVCNKWIISGSDELRYMYIHTAHTRKELEEAGFGEVFNSSLFEVEEVGK